MTPALSSVLSVYPNYNSCFYSNVCHVCKSPDRLKECPSCRMISYCSENHRSTHWPQHRAICDTIVNINNYRCLKNRHELSQEKWVSFKQTNLEIIRLKLRRNLEPYEEQMLLFPKSCLVCCRQVNLSAICLNCFCVNACLDHSTSLQRPHDCQQLLISYQIDMQSVTRSNRHQPIPASYLSVDDSVACDMALFIQHYIRGNGLTSTWTLNDYVYSDDFSGPLTLMHGLRQARLSLVSRTKGVFVIHVVAGGITDRRCLSAWEIFLHALDRDTMLTIVIVMPKLQDRYDFMEICNHCRCNSKVFQYEYRDAPYHNYACSPLHMRPDVIVGFDLEIKNEEVWGKTMKALQRQRCPILLTADSEMIVHQNVVRIHELLQLPLAPVIHTSNRFASRRPYRACWTIDAASVRYPNRFLTIYRDLIIAK